MELNLLIVDDERIIREGLASMDWAAVGIAHVYTARDGEEALERMQKTAIHIVITDVKMQNIDGVELGKRIAATYRGCKVIVLSGYDDFQFARSAVKFGALDYLLKPVDDEELLDAVKKAVALCRQETSRDALERKRSRVEELKLDLDEPNRALLDNFDGLLLHNDLFADDPKIPKVGTAALSPQILTALNYINLHYAEDLTAEILADLVLRSKNYFCVQFKKEMRLNLIDYVNQVRIQNAKHLLRETGYMSCEISDMVGYSDYRYFCTVFKKYTGMTPSGYRERRSGQS